MKIEDNKNGSNPNTDNENESLPDLKTIWECNKIIRLSTHWNCGWCQRSFSQFNENRALHHCSKINFPSPVGIGTCEAQIPSNYLQQYQKMAKKKIDSIQKKKRSQAHLSHNISSTNERISQQLFLQKTKRFKSDSSKDSGRLSDISDESPTPQVCLSRPNFVQKTLKSGRPN